MEVEEHILLLDDQLGGAKEVKSLLGSLNARRVVRKGQVKLQTERKVRHHRSKLTVMSEAP